ncbi:MAG: hypothetical protein M1830_003463 [Pleopsidium flavum]|nr:MAG: hypothetical protein M1830_003463 [Pleopsidium flavum]
MTTTRSHSPSNQNGTPTHRHRSILHPSGTHSPPEPTSAEIRDAAARAAKNIVREKLREDWEWDPAASLLRRLNDNDDDNDDTVSDEDDLLTWREREMDSSDPEPSTFPPPSPPSHQQQSQTQSFKFDSPDSIGLSILERKHKRRRLLEDETRWNTGLQTWTLRRDDWTGGRVRRVRHPYPNPINTHAPSSSQHLPSQDYYTTKTEVVPLAPPLLPPTNPIRASITPNTYASIYAKVVVQGLAPTVPINLSDMTRALVVGWKEDDLWPPKPATLVSGVGTGVGARRGGGALGIGNGDFGTGAGRIRDRENMERESRERERERERGFSKGVGVFKRALGLGVGMNGSLDE